MGSTSKFVSNGKETVRSALVKAFDAWKEPFDIRPGGVFGSKAIVRTGDVTISSDKLDLEFQVPF